MPAITYYGPEEGWEELRAELERQGVEVEPLAEYMLDPATAAGFMMETVAAFGIQRAIEAAIDLVKSRFKEAKVDVEPWFVVECVEESCGYQIQVPVDQYREHKTLPTCPNGHAMRIIGLDQD